MSRLVVRFPEEDGEVGMEVVVVVGRDEGEAVVLRSNDVSRCHSCSCRWRILRVSLTLDTRVNYDSSSSCAPGMWSRFVLIARQTGPTYLPPVMDGSKCIMFQWGLNRTFSQKGLEASN